MQFYDVVDEQMSPVGTRLHVLPTVGQRFFSRDTGVVYEVVATTPTNKVVVKPVDNQPKVVQL